MNTHPSFEGRQPLFKHFSYFNTYIKVKCNLVLIQEHMPTKHVYKRNWTTCPKYDNRSRFNNHRNKGRPTWSFNQHENLHFDSEIHIHELWTIWTNIHTHTHARTHTHNIWISCHNFHLSCSILMTNRPCSVNNTKCKLNIICFTLWKKMGIKELQCCNHRHLPSEFSSKFQSTMMILFDAKYDAKLGWQYVWTYL